MIGWEGLSDAPYPILGTRARMMEAVADFRAWAEAEPERQSREGWEYGYEFWPVLTAIFCRFLDASDPRAWDGPLVGTLLYILARDNAQCVLRKELSVRPGHLTALARAGTTSTEIEARWQLAAALAEAEIQDGEIHADEALGLLRTYAVDTDAYVRRMALLALARRRAPDTEALARRAWISGDEWERIGALHALEAVGSPQLPSYLAVAEREGGEFLRAHAREIAGRQDGVAPPPGMA